MITISTLLRYLHPEQASRLPTGSFIYKLALVNSIAVYQRFSSYFYRPASRPVS